MGVKGDILNKQFIQLFTRHLHKFVLGVKKLEVALNDKCMNDETKAGGTDAPRFDGDYNDEEPKEPSWFDLEGDRQDTPPDLKE